LLIDTRLIEACALLLGASPRRIGAAYLQQLDPATVRRAWRALAVSSHPDASRRGGAKPGANDGRRFIEASRAYELVMRYLLSRPARPMPSARGGKRAEPAPHGTTAKRSTAEKRAQKTTADKQGPAGTQSRTDKQGAGPKRGGPLFYKGPVPRRRLRLAEFLYYTGRVSWQSLISAVVWQRRAQPRFGELAREMRTISSQDLARILGSRLRHEQTGETAQRLRLLSAAEVERILRLQRARKKPIGRYFLEQESMTSATLVSLLRELHRHNARWGRQR
jgi:hypothetical protein